MSRSYCEGTRARLPGRSRTFRGEPERAGRSCASRRATSTYGGTNNATVVSNYITQYTSAAFLSTQPIGHMDVVFDSNLPLHQAFAFTTTVPEPSTWAMMILGLGGVGAALRRRRAQAVFA